MGRINWSRVLVGGLIAGSIWTLLSALSTWYLGAEFSSYVPGNRVLQPTAGLFIFLFFLSLAGGVWAMWLYASIRPRYGAGAESSPKSASSQ